MIVSTKDEIVRLAGALVKNQWLTIKAAANLLLQNHPQGIIIDCGELDHVSEDGAKTFLEAMKDIQSTGARIMVANLPDNVMAVIRTVPGVRSQLPIAGSIEEARSSLRLAATATPLDGDRPISQQGILVPLMADLDPIHAVTISARLAREFKAPVHLVYFLSVARNVPLNTPVAAEEAMANKILEDASSAARKMGLSFERHLERVRDVDEAVLLAIKNYKVTHVVLGAFAEHTDEERFHGLVDTLLHRAPCNVLIGRKALETSPA